MISKEKVLQLIANTLEEKNIFVVSLSISPANSIRLFVDSMEGVKIEDCVRLSRDIEHNLDREAEDFELEVSSAGLDMPLQVKQQYLKNIGREVEFFDKDGKKCQGSLVAANDTHFSVEQTRKVTVEGKKKKQLLVETVHLAYDEVSKVKIVIKF